MSNAMVVISIVGFVFGCIGLVAGCVSISMVCGFLRSTHTIQWKPLETSDPFAEEEEVEEIVPNVNKMKLKPKSDFAFMEDVADQNNF